MAHAGRQPLGRPAPPRRPRRPARRRLGRGVPRRAHQPPRRRGHRLARAPPEGPVGVGCRCARRRDARSLVPRRGLHRHVGGARRDRRALRGRVCGVRAAAGGARSDGRGIRGEAAEPHAQGARLAAPRRAGAHVEAEVPHRGREPAHRERAAGAQPGRAQPSRGGPPRQGRRRPRGRVGRVPGGGCRARSAGHEDRAARARVAHRAGGAHRHPGRERRGQVDAARTRHGRRAAHHRTREARQDGEDRHAQPGAGRARRVERAARQRRDRRAAHRVQGRRGLQGRRAHARASCSSGSGSRTRSCRRR